LLLIDAGTSYIKTLDTSSGQTQIIPVKERDLYFKLSPSMSTGHNSAIFKSSKRISELVALTDGIRAVSKDDDFTVLDIGSRDMKLVSFHKGSFEKCDWNTSCGAMIGFTIELMMKYFSKSPSDLPETEKCLDITCGLLGITKFFDSISKEESIEENLSALINGMANYAWHFAGKPKSLYLSGGLSENRIFLHHLGKIVPDLRPTGRFTLLEGLRAKASKEL